MNCQPSLVFCIQLALNSDKSMLLEINTSPTCRTVSGGSGVPPGTKLETCKRCKGSGKVSIMLESIRFLLHAWEA